MAEAMGATRGDARGFDGVFHRTLIPMVLYDSDRMSANVFAKVSPETHDEVVLEALAALPAWSGEGEHHRHDGIDRQQLDAFEPVRFPLLADVRGDQGG
jgi:hypothetical protein